MPTLPKILKCQQVAKSLLFRVEQLELEFSNGVRRTYERLAGGKTAAVIIVPMLDDDTVLLIREYGVGAEAYELGLPKGKVDAGESHIEAANRELKEEVGYGAKHLELMKCLSQSPNYMQHKTQIVLAKELYEERLEGDEPEPLEVVPAKLSEIERWIAREDLTEARTIAALLLAKGYMQDQA